MSRPDRSAKLDRHQAAVAAGGLKAMMPVGRPFLDYVLTMLADAGFEHICLVIGPDRGAIRDYYQQDAKPRRFKLSFAHQEKPLGTADAVLAAEDFAGSERFLVVNSDTYYPVQACRALHLLGEAGVAAFWRDALIAEGNLSPERVAGFPTIEMDGQGFLTGLLEPADARAPAPGADALVSMNCWMFSRAIFRACRAIAPSPSGELELPEAVRYAIAKLGERMRVLPFREGVLDLTTRADVASVALPRRVRARHAAEPEGGDRLLAQPVPVDRDLPVGVDDVPALPEGGGAPVDHVAAVDGDHHLGPPRRPVANADEVPLPEVSEDVRPPAVVKGGQRGSRLVHDLERVGPHPLLAGTVGCGGGGNGEDCQEKGGCKAGRAHRALLSARENGRRAIWILRPGRSRGGLPGRVRRRQGSRRYTRAPGTTET